jgi:hypothetical protein
MADTCTERIPSTSHTSNSEPVYLNKCSIMIENGGRRSHKGMKEYDKADIANHPGMNKSPVEAAVLRRQSRPIIASLQSTTRLPIVTSVI